MTTGPETVEETKVVDPAELEKAMLAKSSEAVTDPEEVAATLFTLYLPRFHARVDGMSNKALRRLIKAIIEHPLEDKPYYLKEEDEKEAFAIANALLDSKYVMVFNTYSKGLDTLVTAEAATTEVTAEASNNDLGNNKVVNEGESNG